MKTFALSVRRLSLALFVIFSLVVGVSGQTTTFTYHGKIDDNSLFPVQYDLQFNLYDQIIGTNSPLNTNPIVVQDVEVTRGEFTVLLDFGNLFNTGADRFLEIGYRPSNSTGAFTLMSPRQQITSSPYAIRSLSAATADTAANAQNLGGTASNIFVQTTDSRLTDSRTPTAGSGNYIQNTSSLQSGANFNIGGTGTASLFNATTQFNIGGNRVLSVPGTDNIFVGNSAGNITTTGSGNSFFGTGAGSNNTTGGNNLFAGHLAGQSNTSGVRNTIIGANANVLSGNLVFATAIGANALVNTSNTIVLGKIAGTYDGILRPADTVQVPGNLNVVGTISGNISGSSFTNLNASNITTGTLADARLSSNIATLSGIQTFTGATTFAGGINGNGSGLTNLNASNIATGTLDNARLGVIGAANGGTGLTASGASGNFLRSNGTGFVSVPLTVTDIPPGNANYIQNTMTQQATSNFNISGNGTAANLTASGTLSGDIVNATTQFNIGGSRVLSAAGTDNIFVGNTAGNGNTTGSANSFFGTNSGLSNTTGSNNTTIGSSANVGANNLSYATAIGADATVATSNTIILGRSAGQDAVQIPGSLNVTGAISGNINGAGLTNLNASNIATGTLDNARLGVIGLTNGGTGITSAGANGNFLRSNGTGFTSTTLTAGDVPDLSATYLRNQTGVAQSGGFNISGNGTAANLTASGTLSGNTVNATTQFNIGGSRVLSVDSASNLFAGKGAGSANTLGFDNSFVGTDAGSGNTTGFYNSFLGYRVGFSNTTGSGNSFFGYKAGFSNTTANGNSFFGVNTGLSNTTGFHNSFLGYQAGFSNTEGNSNSFVGVQAGYSNTTGTLNSFVGANAGYNNTTGFSNLFAGYQVGFNNTTGSANSFVGYQAGYTNLTGNSGSFFGANAGFNNTTGFFNSFFGYLAGFSNTEGSNNSFIGTQSGYNSTTGSLNSFLGINAGYNNTSGSSNLFAGYQAGLTNTTGSSNTIIGATANVGSNNLSFATAIGASATVSTSNTIVLGRSAGQDTILSPGLLQLNTLGTGGSSVLCRNASNQIATCSSSLRYKTNIAPFAFGLDLVQRLHPITFTWKDGGMKDLGFGAEDVAAINPLLVNYNAKGEVEGVKYDRISTVLVNAVKEQQTQIEAQQSQLKQQQTQIESQQRQLKQQQTLIDGLKKLLCQQNPNADVCR